jgi:hypothetical protein
MNLSFKVAFSPSMVFKPSEIFFENFYFTQLAWIHGRECLPNAKNKLEVKVWMEFLTVKAKIYNSLE